jgi:hypothetical protein
MRRLLRFAIALALAAGLAYLTWPYWELIVLVIGGTP